MSSRAHAEIVLYTSLQGLACVSPDWMSNCQYNGTGKCYYCTKHFSSVNFTALSFIYVAVCGNGEEG